MNMKRIFWPAAAALLFAGEVCAQSESEEAQRAIDAREMEMAERLREAEEQMEIAARVIAEITSERLPHLAKIERHIDISGRPRIGITIDGENIPGQVDGVVVGGVTPESAADDAGLRAGDVITAVNGESMSADSSEAADSLLLDFMSGVEEGDELRIDYSRSGTERSVELTPRVMEMNAFSWAPDMGQGHMPGSTGVVIAPDSIKQFEMRFGFPFAGGVWGNMELVELSDGLGKYFGADEGLLIVRAPKSDEIDLQDGDVIQSIDGREPKDVRHAMRILSSYQSGELLKLGIMRDKKSRTIEVEVPADHRGSLIAPPAAKPVRAPTPPKAPVETAST